MLLPEDISSLGDVEDLVLLPEDVSSFGEADDLTLAPDDNSPKDAAELALPVDTVVPSPPLPSSSPKVAEDFAASPAGEVAAAAPRASFAASPASRLCLFESSGKATPSSSAMSSLLACMQEA